MPKPENIITPCNIDAERILLCLLVKENEAYDKTLSIIEPNDFFVRSHYFIYEAISSLFQTGQHPSVVTITEKIKELGGWDLLGGPGAGVDFIESILDTETNSTTAIEVAQIVRSKSFLRKGIQIGEYAQKIAIAEGADGDDVIKRIEKSLQEALGERRYSEVYQIPQIIVDRLSMASERQQKASSDFVTGLDTGFESLNYMTTGFQPSNLIIMAARPGVGKSSLSLQIAAHVSINQELPVIIHSYEMSREELTDRLLCIKAHVDGQRWKRGLIYPDEWDRLKDQARILSKAKLYVTEGSAVTAGEVWNVSRRIYAQQGLSLIIVDHLQLMHSLQGNGNRVQEMNEITRTLKRMAMDLKVPVIAISQLSRAVENRPDKRPLLSDLKESSSIESDADIVMFLYRESLYKLSQTGSIPEMDKTEVIISKNRSGPTGKFILGFRPSFAEFVEMDHTYSSSYGDDEDF